MGTRPGQVYAPDHPNHGSGRRLRAQEVPDPLQENNLLRHSGRGLFLMGAFMDDLKVRKLPEGGTEVTLIKEIGPPE